MANLFRFIQEEMQENYLPDFIDHDTFLFIERLANMEARLDDLRKSDIKDEEEEKSTFRKTIRLEIPLEEEHTEKKDYLQKEREEISELLRSTNIGFSAVKHKNNEDILKRVHLDLTISMKKKLNKSSDQLFEFTSKRRSLKVKGSHL